MLLGLFSALSEADWVPANRFQVYLRRIPGQWFSKWGWAPPRGAKSHCRRGVNKQGALTSHFIKYTHVNANVSLANHIAATRHDDHDAPDVKCRCQQTV